MSPILTGRPRARVVRPAALLAAAALALAGVAAVAPRAHAADPVLLSQGKTATASSSENADYYKASYAVDGDDTTRWSSAAQDGQWLQVDLGATATLARAEIRWEGAYADGYKIQVSADGTAWTDAYTTTSSDGGSDTDTLSGSGRYVRVLSTHRATGYGISIYELRVYGTSGGSGGGTVTPGTGSLLSQGKTATASTTENADYYKPAYAVDGKSDTRWSSTAADGQWLQVDLGATATLSRVELDWENAYADAYKIQVSADASTWKDAYATTTGKGGKEVDATSGTGRYVRVLATHRATGYGISLYEVRVYGTTGGSTDPGDGGGTPGTPTDVTGPLTGASVVKVAGGNGSWQLTVNGQPYTVKGMTWGPSADQAEHYMPTFVKLGANTLRTWGTGTDSKQLFDVAAKYGVRVVAGFWLGPGGGPGSGGCPDYVNDANYKSSSMTDILNQVNTYKSHPAVLIWDVGNESVLGLQNCYSGTQLEAQRAAYTTFVNDVAKAIHQADPNHPVTSTDAWVGAWDYYKKYSPDLDLLALNSYGAVCDAAAYWKQGNFGKPYILTEGGPEGDWEAPKDAFGLPDQGTDQDNADGYTNSWKCLMSHTGVALGGTLFHFGIEGDYGGVWFNVIPGDNKRLSYYAVAKAFGGSAAQPGVNTPPRFASMSVDNAAAVPAGGKATIRASVTDPDGDAITYHTSLNSIGIDKATGTQEVPFTQTSPGVFQIDAPSRPGVWKVYVWAEDGHSNVGVQTVDMRVVPPTVAGTNIALHKTATASSFDPYNGNWSPGQAVDGDLSTRWASNWDDDEWIQVDLGSVQSFHAVQLVWESAFAKGYQVQVSNDGTTWSTVKTVTDGDGGVDTLDVAGSGRYVRIHGTQRGTAYGYSLYELGIYQ